MLSQTFTESGVEAVEAVSVPCIVAINRDRGPHELSRVAEEAGRMDCQLYLEDLQ